MRREFFKRNLFHSLLLLAVSFFVAPAAVRAAQLNTSGVYEAPSAAGYIAPNTWHTFPALTAEDGDPLYYTIEKKPNTYYWVNLYTKLPDSFKGSYQHRASVGIYDRNDESKYSDGYTSKQYASPYYNWNYKDLRTGWVLFQPGERIVIKLDPIPGEKVFLQVLEDEYGQKLDSVPSSLAIERGEKISGTLPTKDSDFIRFQADGNSLYRVRIVSETLSDGPEKGEDYATHEPVLKLYQDGRDTRAKFVPFRYGVEKELFYMEGGKGIAQSDGSSVYYLSLEPGSTTLWEISGDNVRYTITFEKADLSVLKKELELSLYCEEDVTKKQHFTGESTFIYEGSPIEPKVGIQSASMMYYGDVKILVVEEDNYRIAGYKNNNTPGVATVVVEGKGNITGTLEIPFTIIPDPSAPEVGTTLKDTKGGGQYKVTEAGASVAYVKPLKNKTSVSVPATVKLEGRVYKVTSIAKRAFSGKRKLKKVTIGKNVVEIGAKAFYNCKALTSVTIPASVQKIGKSVFQGCKKLKKITIKTEKLTSKSVGLKAFTGTPKNASVKVPKKVKSAYKKWLGKKGLHKKAKIK